MVKPIVIVGAGQAAASFISRHVALGNQQPLHLIGDEPAPPYQRPPLSKKYLSGELERERLFIRPQHWYQDQGITTDYGISVASIQRDQKRLSTTAGKTIDYDKLLLCTGSRPRTLAADIGGDLQGVYTLRNIADVDAMAAEFQPGRQLLVIGGGYIGLEVAAVARKMGLKVTIVESAERILQRVAAPETSDYFRALHQEHGVDIRESTQLLRLNEQNGRVSSAELINGEQISADFVLVGIGALPNSELAQQAGLTCNNGISVNAQCQTSDASIYAAGDCSNFVFNGQHTRLESVQNAADQGDLIAHVFAAEAVNYHPLPWFWSDQYDCKLQIAGLNSGYTETVTRISAKGQSVWYYTDGEFIAVDAMNDTLCYAMGRKMLSKGINPSAAQIADPNVDLKALAK